MHLEAQASGLGAGAGDVVGEMALDNGRLGVVTADQPTREVDSWHSLSFVVRVGGPKAGRIVAAPPPGTADAARACFSHLDAAQVIRLVVLRGLPEAGGHRRRSRVT